MTKYLLAGAALAAIAASPAAARDHSAYFGIEVGAMHVNDSHFDFDFGGNDIDAFDLDHKIGVDGDLIAGYDFGIFRAELEGAYKWAELKDVSEDGDDIPDADGHSRAYSLMANAMVDLGRNEGVNFYAGAGAGIAWVHQSVDFDGDDGDDDAFSIRDSKFAWQLIAGIRAPVWTHFDLGLKYRYFNAGKIHDDFEDEGRIDLHGKFRSHSLLASLIYNFNPPAAPPP